MFKESVKTEVKMVTGVIAGCLLLHSGNAFSAEFHSSSVVSIQTPTMIAGSNGKTYTHNKSGNFKARIHVRMDAGFSGRFKSWRTWLSLGPDGILPTYWPEYQLGAYQQHYSSGDRPKRVNRTVDVFAQASEFEPLMLGQCNLLAKELRDQGLSNQEIFSQNREIKFFASSRLSYDQTGVDGNEFIGASRTPEFKVLCEKHRNLSGAGSIAQVPPQVTEVSTTLVEQPSLNGGECRVRISGVFRTDRANTEIKYRYIYTEMDGSNKKVSNLKTTQTGHAKVAMTTDIYDIPIVDGRERGRIRIKSIQPNSVKSGWKNFDMNCSEELGVAVNHPIQREIKFVPSKTQKYGDQVCPVNGHIVAKLQATGTPFNGTGKLTVRNKFGETHASPTVDVNLTESAMMSLEIPYAIRWGGNGTTLMPNLSWPHPAMKQTLKWRLTLAKEGSNGPGTPAPLKNLVVYCKYPGAPLVTQVTPGLAAVAPQLADLTILKAEQTGKKKMKILISNKGKKNASNFKILMSGGAANSKSILIGNLKAKKSKWVTIKLPKKAPKAIFRIDNANQIKESNEQNNTLTKKFK